MSTLANTKTARRITGLARQATNGRYRLTTETGNGCYLTRILGHYEPGHVMDDREELRALNTASGLINSMPSTGWEATVIATTGRSGTVYRLKVTDVAADEKAREERAASYQATMDRELGRTESPAAGMGHAIAEAEQRDAARQAAQSPQDAPEAPAQPDTQATPREAADGSDTATLGRSARIAAVVASFEYRERNVDGHRGYAIFDRHTGRYLGVMQRRSLASAGTDQRWQVRDADGIVRVVGDYDRGTAALRFAEGIVSREQAAEEAEAFAVAESKRWAPDEVLPSGRYGVKTVELDGDHGPVVQVVQQLNSGRWGSTPARYAVGSLADLADASVALSIDHGQGWTLSGADTRALGRHAARLLADWATAKVGANAALWV